ncbi:DUF262 domain-containing protein [Acidovorax sp. Leaf160]|uniref:DUF262 domain-containing protein n=1 Tax=Acidovorax sp. Leaf160 TaxID=1736280 RepID=UPI0009ECADEA|nr:DUF262 domain-containing protein [Acidovorax sp. Leaf160]
MSSHNLFKIHRLDSKTLSWWKNRRDQIDFEPSYQRKGRRWSTSDKQYLVDSILNGFDVPKFYVADFVFGSSKLNEKKKSYAVIDGKQRLEAIFDFFDDEFGLSPTFKLFSNPGLHLGGKKYSELKRDYPAVAEDFDNFNPDVVGVISDDLSFIEELFVRLNRSKPLSGAELRNAFSSPITGVIREIGNHPFFSHNIRFNTNKGQNLNAAAKILMFEVAGIQETKKTSLDKFVEQYSVDDNDATMELTRIFDVLGLMSDLFLFRDPLLQSEGNIPVYYWLVRNSPQEHVIYLRDFLEEFQEFIRTGPPPRNRRQLLSVENWNAYKAASRSINDRTSHETRFEILESSFLRWLHLNH